MFQIVKKIAKNSAIYGLGSLSTKIIGFILLPFYTDYLTTSEYGIFSLVEIVAWLLTVFVSFKINAAFFRWYWDKKYIDKRKSIFFSSLTFFLVSILIFILPLYFFNKEISHLFFETYSYTYLINLMLISSALQVFINLTLHLMQLKEKSIFYTSTNITKLIFSLVLNIILITKFERGINGIYEALIISQLIFIILTSKFIFSNIEVKIEPKIIKEMISFSYPLMLAELSGILLIVADRFVLNFMKSASDVGIYSLGFRIANTIKILVYTPVMLAVSPLIYEYIDKPNNKRFYSKIMTYLALGVMLFVLIFSFFSKEIIELVAVKKDYWEAQYLVPIFTITIFFGILKDTSLTGLTVAKKTGVIAVVVFVMTLLNIGLNILFVPIWGTKGSAFATLIVGIVSFFTFFYFAQKHYKIPYELQKIFKLLVLAISLIYLSSLTENLGLVYRLLIKFFLLIIFPFILYLSNFFEPIELQRIKEAWKKWKNLKNFKENISKIKLR